MKDTLKTKLFLVLFVTLCNLSIANPLDLDRRSQITVHTHYNAMIEHYQNKNWKHLAYKCQDLIADFPDSPLVRESYYYLGVAYYQLEEFEYANQAFSRYLKEDLSPKFFDQVMRFKFEIAQAFEEGVCRHLFGWKRLPKWMPAHKSACAIYDEIITTLPRDDLTAHSLYRKGCLLLFMKKYKASVEAFQTLIRRFPKHHLSPEGYLGIASVYLTQCENEFPDSDHLDLAQVNLRKFRHHFPGEPRIVNAENMLLRIKEKLATDLFEIAQFYVRTGKKEAAIIYYSIIIKQYPDTGCATRSQKCLQGLNATPSTIVENNNH